MTITKQDIDDALALLDEPPVLERRCAAGDDLCPCQDGDACHYRDAADGTKAWPAPAR